MKLKLSILLIVLCSILVTAFGQKETPKTTTKTKTKTEAKTVKPKTIGAKPSAVKMPTVKKILAKYVQAIGGRKANGKIKNRMVKGSAEIPAAGIKGTFEYYTAAPDKSLSKIMLAGIGEIIEGFDGTTAWSINPIQGNRDKQGEELAQTKITYNFYRELNLDKLYPKMELKGMEKLGDKDVYVIVATPENLPPETFYFDAKSGLLLRQDIIVISPEGKLPTKTFFEDIREVDGVKIPFKIRSVLPQFEIIATTTEVKNNIAIQDNKFTKPKS